MSEQHTKYHIKTLADFSLVPEDKIEECLTDFKTWLEMRRDSKALVEQLGLSGLINMTDEYVWIDDGIRGVSQVTINFGGEK